MEYGSQIWYKVKANDKHETFHLSYIKSTLGVRSQTPTDAVMKKLDAFPYSLENPVCNAFNTLVQLHNFGQRNWWTEVSVLLELLEIDEPDILTTAPVDAKIKIITSIKDSVFKTQKDNCMARFKDSSEGKLSTVWKLIYWTCQTLTT